jgi:predicted amidophosphoribosyltransferase
MGVIIFFLLALVVAGVIAYPLLSRRTTAQPVAAVTDTDIERAVRRLRRVPSAGDQRCPACGRAHQPTDRFCVGCGQVLSSPASAGLACPSCGTAIRREDRFCARCGETLSTGEAA